ncbi:unnamed protein product [Nezara viridula]|uniref:Uncharacterized protein n=1 Tax=Nezara viridula TaxID=85310 RepID=A0A9P0E167_NEZVI|nr:unnamed protein product [Nezara viridula]
MSIEGTSEFGWLKQSPMVNSAQIRSLDVKWRWLWKKAVRKKHNEIIRQSLEWSPKDSEVAAGLEKRGGELKKRKCATHD